MMSTTEEVSAEFPFESKFVEVHGAKMHYVEQGQGDPILFLHGNPMSSYLWRNIIPHLSGQGRCIAPDLIGMGKSEHPDIGYTYDDQYRYLCGFIDALDLGSNVTLVLHDWGSLLGFRWANDHRDDVKSIAFMEAMIRPMSLDDLPVALRLVMRMMRAPVTGWLMVSVANVLLKKLIPDLTYAEISPEALAHYQSAHPTIASRKPLLQLPRELPLDGKPAGNFASVQAYQQWLTETDVPKLLLHGNDGVAIKQPDIAWCEEHLANLDIVDLGEGRHFLQETHPARIGSELSKWYAKG
jgi:haloalkane dehalogenase